MSMFLDTAKISVKAGRGGDGMVAFRREKYVPNGGPWGGDGGKGGSVIFKVDEGLRTLMDFRYNRKFKAKNGEKGMTKGMHGRGAEDLIVSIPLGTTVRDAETGKVITDMVEDGQEFVIAHGGRGGRGNIRFATPRNPAPEIAENGEPGEERELQLELKILADVGLVGFPSVGKSTILSVVTAAKPKIGAYHFTTIVPNLGMVRTKSGESFAMADLPGLIEGASQGVGLGTQFLRHIERTRVILHVIDMSASEGRDPYEDYLQINKELETYNLRLMERPQIIVANKMDMPGAEENLKEFKGKIWLLTMMNLMSCHKFSQFQVWLTKVWKISWKLLQSYLMRLMNSCFIAKTIWNKKKCTTALTRMNVHLKLAVMTMPHGYFLVRNLKNSLS